jgi:flagellar biosynthesis/type III secretory pathway protein FliH
MQGIQVRTLTNEELARYAYLWNDAGLPKDVVDEILSRFTHLIDMAEKAENVDDKLAEADEDGYQRGYQHGYDACMEEHEFGNDGK